MWSNRLGPINLIVITFLLSDRYINYIYLLSNYNVYFLQFSAKMKLEEMDILEHLKMAKSLVQTGTNKNKFLVEKLVYKSNCPSVCPYVNHV